MEKQQIDLMKLQILLNECIMIEEENYLDGGFSSNLKEVQLELDKILWNGKTNNNNLAHGRNNPLQDV